MKKDSIVEMLKAEFQRKKLRNSAYSLRSYSRDLEIDPSNLSKILNYRKELGTELKTKLAQKIGLSSEDLHTLSESSFRTQDVDYNHHGLDSF